MNNLSRNRSFKYGDGLFETLSVINSKVVFLKEHFDRLSLGFEILSYDRPDDFSSEWLEIQILKFIDENKNANLSDWRVRITFWRNTAGFFRPESNTVSWDIEIFPLSQSSFKLNEKGYEIGIYPDVIISPDILSGIKTCSALPYVMAAIYKDKMGWDDALLLNSNGRIVEASSSNIFVLKNKKLLSPTSAEGALPGVCRRKIIDSASEIGLDIVEDCINIEDLCDADEIWLTNVISGIRWVKNLYGSEALFQSFYAERMTDLLNIKAKS